MAAHGRGGGGLVHIGGLLLAFGGCTSEEVDDTGPPADPCAVAEAVTDYVVDWSTEPEAVAGEQTAFTLKVRDQRGCPIEDLQQAHERMVHTLLIGTDLTSFQHLHHEDFADLSADDLRDSTYSFPVTFPAAGDYRLVFDYAHQNEYLTTFDWITVGGSPAQAAAPALDYTLVRTVGDLVVVLRWDVEPYAGFESSWTALVCDPAGAPDPERESACDAYGGEITDMVQWLGADAHAAVASADLAWVSHTHAWFPDMENVAPGHDMPHLYDGPELPFHFTFPTAGAYKMWLQFTRVGAPDAPYVADFAFDVAP